MNKQARIFVAGHRGLVGSAIVRRLRALGHEQLLFAERRELDLTRQAEVETWFAAHRPEVVIMAAAKVGGIHANSSYAAEFIRDARTFSRYDTREDFPQWSWWQI
jgi:GDP-L-fucose synthase